MEEEINLVDYIKVLYHQRRFVFGVVLIFLAAAIIFSFLNAVNIYEGSGIIEIGNMDIYQEGAVQKFIPETASQIKAKIESRAYDSLIKENTVNKNSIRSVEVVLPKDQKDIDKITVLRIKIQANNPKDGKNYLDNLLNAIVSYHNEEFLKKEKYLNSLISEEKAKISALEKNPNIPALQYLYVEHLSNIKEASLSLASIERTKILDKTEGFSLAGQNKIILNLAIALILGIFVGVSLAFLRDFWKRNKKEITGK